MANLVFFKDAPEANKVEKRRMPKRPQSFQVFGADALFLQYRLFGRVTECTGGMLWIGQINLNDESNLGCHVHLGAVRYEWVLGGAQIMLIDRYNCEAYEETIIWPRKSEIL
jgi:hypothetical protein